MPLPNTKIELLNNLDQAYEKLDAEFDAVESEYERDCGIEGNVSCCDIVAYQIGWGSLLVGWEKLELAGKTPEMPAPGFKWNQLGELANSFYEEQSKKSLQQLRNEFSELHQVLVNWINSLSELELFQPQKRRWTGEKWAIAKWIQVNTVAPYRSARTKVRRWKKEMKI
jgi:hypothetical protein